MWNSSSNTRKYRYKHLVNSRYLKRSQNVNSALAFAHLYVC